MKLIDADALVKFLWNELREYNTDETIRLVGVMFCSGAMATYEKIIDYVTALPGHETD